MRLLAASALVLTLAAPHVAVAAQQDTETVDRTVSIGPRGVLKLTNFSGDIRITGAPGNDVVIHAVRRGERERLDNITLEITTSGSTVSIDANKRNSNWREENNNVVETTFDIRVPRGTTLDLNSFSGKIDVRGVTGEVDAETFSGDIHARVPSSASGRVRFDSFSGSVRSDLPISMGSRSKRDVDATLGSGNGPTLTFKTFSGDLRILK